MFGDVLDLYPMCSAKVGALSAPGSDDTDDAEGGGVRGKGLRGFAEADLREYKTMFKDFLKKAVSLVQCPKRIQRLEIITAEIMSGRIHR